jgi:DNA-binding CsgD family transcriptional regulator/tetratricopeptide (TPR) repeat protein
LPRRFHALVADRVAMLSPGARHLLEVASLLDRWFAVDPLAGVLGQSPSGLLPVLDEALSAGVLHARGPHLGFWCGLGRRAVAETIPEPVRNALLRQIGTARETGPGSGLAEYPLAARPARSEDEVSATLLAQSARRAWHEGRLGEALDRAQELVRRAAQSPLGDGPAGFTDPRLTLAGMLVDVGRHDEADRIVGTLAGDAERAADPLVAAELATIRARLSLDVGHLDAAEAEAANAEAACAEAPDLGARQLFPRAVCMRAAVAFRRGDLHGAAQHLERRRAALIDTPAAFGSARCRFVEAQLASAEHGAARAVELLGGIYDDLSELRGLLVDEAAAAGWMVRTALSAGDHGRATAVAIAAADLAGENPDFPTVVAGSTQARGVLDQDAEALIRSAGDHRQLWARASAAEDAGVVLAEQGDRHRALAQLDQAMAAYHQAGAAGDAGRVRSRLRGLGVRRRHWRQAVRPVCGWASLTDTECSVAGLVAEGLTNRQVAGRMFLSPHTIDFHLRQIFRKLDIGSRVELTRQVVGRDSEGPPDARPVPV